MMKLVLCNCPESSAQSIAKALVEEKYAACVNLLGAVTSIYRWDGRVVEEIERPLLIKTAADRVDQVRIKLLELHPYSVPEILVLEIDPKASYAEYIAWVVRETSKD